MKKFLSSVFPYLLIAAFFIGVIAYSAKTAANPLYSYELTESLPEAGVKEASDTQSVPTSSEENAAQTETVAPESEKTGTVCYYTPNGTKYHLDRNCRYLKNSDVVLETDTETAASQGLTPCSVCSGQ